MWSIFWLLEDSCNTRLQYASFSFSSIELCLRNNCLGSVVIAINFFPWSPRSHYIVAILPVWSLTEVLGRSTMLLSGQLTPLYCLASAPFEAEQHVLKPSGSQMSEVQSPPGYLRRKKGHNQNEARNRKQLMSKSGRLKLLIRLIGGHLLFRTKQGIIHFMTLI